VSSTWVIIPVHNRRDTTVECLTHLKETQNWEQLDVLVIDDGSSDGTAETVESKYPDVHLLRGDGTLWWGGAIKKGMKHAWRHGAEIYIWLNDDVRPEPGAISKLAKKTQTLGNTVLSSRVYPTTGEEYSTIYRKTRWGLTQVPYDTESEIQYADAVAGKFTAIPAAVVDAIGFPDTQSFPHHACDYEYTYRAQESGFNVGAYTAVKARDTAFEREPPRLSADVALEAAVRRTFDPSEHAPYSIWKLHQENKRFIGPPKLLAYLYSLYLLFRSIIAIMLKISISLIKIGQSFQSNR